MAKRLRKGWLAVPVMALLSFMLLGFVVPTVGAQTSTTTTTKDDPTALIKGLTNQRYYVANSVSSDAKFKAANPNIDNELKNAVNKQKSHDVFVAIITNNSFPNGVTSTTQYNQQILGFLNNPTPQALLLINVQNRDYNLLAPKLSSSERDAILADLKSDLVSKSTTVGAVNAVNNIGDKISSNETGGLITTLIIVLVVLVVIVGAVSFLLINTKRNWKQRVSGVENLANQVSDQVVKVSDDINFLPDAVRERTNAQFGVATQNFSEANTRLRELQGVSPITLLLKGPEYERKLNLTGSQFEQARQALGQVAQETQRALPPS